MNVKQRVQRQSLTAWTLQQAIDQLRSNPNDPCLQYIALSLAARENSFAPGQNAFERVQALLPRNGSGNRDADLLSVFGGGAAVQESLQLDAILQEQEMGQMRTPVEADAPTQESHSRKQTQPRDKNPFEKFKKRNGRMEIDVYMRSFDQTVPVNFNNASEREAKWNRWIGPWFHNTTSLWTALASATGFADLELTFKRDGQIIEVQTLELLGDADFKCEIDECIELLDKGRIFALPDDSGETAHLRMLLGAFLRPGIGDSGVDFHSTRWFAEQKVLDRDGTDFRDKLRKRYSYCLANMKSVPVKRAVAPPAASPPRELSIGDLRGPTQASHPWKEMLKGRNPHVSRLSKLVPADFFLVESRSVSKLLQALSAFSSCKDYIGNQLQQPPVDLNLVERIQRQMLIDDAVMELLERGELNEICLAGSDLYLADGSDVSVIVAASEDMAHQLFRDIADHAAAKCDERLSCDYFEYRGINCIAIASRELEISIFAANPLPDIHLRSNSRHALQRILDAITDSGTPKLGESDEFAFVRTLMPWEQADEENVFVYFSDPFIRSLVGPQTRIVQSRRKICQSHLKMIDSSVMLFSAQEGELPSSLDEIRSRRCIPSGRTELKCPDGGTYSLRAEGNGSPLPCGVCSVHGVSALMTPCIDLPIGPVTQQESKAYVEFVQTYNRYWRTYFDPIGISVLVRDREYTVETVVLPLIDNSIYTALAATLGGTPEILDKSCKPECTIFGTTVRLNKDPLLSRARPFLPLLGSALGEGMQEELSTLLARGLGNQLSFHACDAQPTFGLDLSMLMGLAFATSGGTNDGARQAGGFGMPIWVAALVASLQLPVYLSMDARDTNIVDKCLERISDSLIQVNLPFLDYAKLDMGAHRTTHMISSSFGPVKFRLFLERIGDEVYAATQPQVLDHLWQAKNAPKQNASDQEAPQRAHALLTINPQHWDKMRPEVCLSWRETNRRACHRNLGYLTAFARALDAVANEAPPSVLSGDLSEAARASGRRSCPERGIYSYNPTTMNVECGTHGSFNLPRQLSHKIGDDEAISIPLFEVEQLRAALTFIEHGLHAKFLLRLT